ncbi:MAG: hypothetical protein AAFV29_18725, partial [Myxococcota bacterium]
PSTIAALGGKDRIETLARDGQLFSELQEVLPDGAFDALLPPAWRSILYEGYVPNVEDEHIDELKSLVFDAVDDRYSLDNNYERPAGGPTLAHLYDVTSGGVHVFRPHIDQTLKKLLLSDESSRLDDPLQNRVSPGNFHFAQSAAETTERIEDWLNVPVEWNGRAYQVRDLAIPDNLIRLLNMRFADSTFQRLSADGLVSTGDLERAGLRDHLNYLYAGPPYLVNLG